MEQATSLLYDLEGFRVAEVTVNPLGIRVLVLRYTPSTAFATFPWPDPTPQQRMAVAGAAYALSERRNAIVDIEPLGLTELYNRVDDGAYVDLAKLHKALDEAVAAAYRWPKKVAQNDEELVRRLGELNSVYVQAPSSYHPF
jgi:hypothetical protein